ncbi:hypothetical protein FF38_07447 [Lucilia cuprina]|uniref:Uncharacterized protein n=1 Tax=Lucilia cuprina TaxID=7375 RepID=A0A0L0BVU7_LUCCU|nr:hypothetical protein FF38_07447 [Lucilia cuprina]
MMIPKNSTDFIVNDQLHHRKTNKQQEEHIADTSMNGYNENQKYVYRDAGGKDGVDKNCKDIEKQIDKEKHLKIYYCEKSNGNGDNNNNTTFPGIKNIKGDCSSYDAQLQDGAIDNSSLYESLKIQNLHKILDGSSPYNKLTFEIYNRYPLHINNNEKTIILRFFATSEVFSGTFYQAHCEVLVSSLAIDSTEQWQLAHDLLC